MIVRKIHDTNTSMLQTRNTMATHVKQVFQSWSSRFEHKSHVGCLPKRHRGEIPYAMSTIGHPIATNLSPLGAIVRGNWWHNLGESATG
jgi:hypothetical protein